MPRPKAQGSLAKNQLQLAIALSTSLEESKNRELSKLAEELPADAIEEGAIPNDIKQMQKEFLERLKPPPAVPGKRQRKTQKTSVPVLYTRSSEERMRIITEKVALVLIKEKSVEFYEIYNVSSRKLCLSLNKATRLWNMSFAAPAQEERSLYYIENLSAFISPLDGTGRVKQKNSFPLPGRFLTPLKREPKTSAEASNSQEVTKMSDTQNWSNVLQSNGEPPDSDLEAEAQHDFQCDWIAMLNNPVMSDVTIYTNQKGTIAAHKLVIYARCPIILNDLDFTGSLRWDNVNFGDAFAFMRFIYCGQLAASLRLNQNTRGVVLLARKYKVVDLLKFVFASDIDSCEIDGSLSVLGISEVSNLIGNCSQPTALRLLKSDDTGQSQDLIEISSDECTPSDVTPGRRRKKIRRGKAPNSPVLLENTKRKTLDEKSPSKLISKKLCMELSEEEEVPSPFKCTLFESSRRSMPATNPASPPREPFAAGPNDVEESFRFTSSQLSDSEPETETLSQMLRTDTLLQPGKACAENSTWIGSTRAGCSPPKTPTSRTTLYAQDYKKFLEDSFIFDVNLSESVTREGDMVTTTFHRPQDSVTPSRTPLVDVKTSSPATPMPDYTNMTNQQLEAQLCRFGLKRSLSRKKGIKMLKHIYGKLHPLVEVVVQGGREYFLPIAAKSPSSSVENHAPQPICLEIAKLGEIPENVDEDQMEEQPLSQSYSISSSDGSDVMEESIFAEEDNAGIEDSADLKTVVQAWISNNADLHESVLRYEPIWLESIHSDLKEYTKKNLKLSQLMDILDEEGITFRIAQKISRNVRRKKTSPKKKPTVEKYPKQQPTSKKNVARMQNL